MSVHILFMLWPNLFIARALGDVFVIFEQFFTVEKLVGKMVNESMSSSNEVVILSASLDIP